MQLASASILKSRRPASTFGTVRFINPFPPLFLAACAALSAAEPPAKPAMKSSVFDWTSLAVQPTPNGERRILFNAPTATLNGLSGHITTLRAGLAAHPAHRHPDEEMIVVKEGTIEVTINGTSQRAGAGSVFFFASNDLHGMKNVGDTAASYYVFRFVTDRTPPKTDASGSRSK